LKLYFLVLFSEIKKKRTRVLSESEMDLNLLLGSPAKKSKKSKKNTKKSSKKDKKEKNQKIKKKKKKSNSSDDEDTDGVIEYE
jgi:hypothetical protein